MDQGVIEAKIKELEAKRAEVARQMELYQAGLLRLDGALIALRELLASEPVAFVRKVEGQE